MSRDPADILAEAEERARLARGLIEHPAMQRAYQALSARYIEQWRASDPDTDQGASDRDSAYFMLRALDVLLDEIKTAVTGGEVTRHNLGATLRSNGRI